MADIILNFLPLKNSEFEFSLYARQADGPKDPEIYECNIKKNGSIVKYWVSEEEKEGFTLQDFKSFDSISLTKYILQLGLKKSLTFENYKILHSKSKFGSSISIVSEELPQGIRLLSLKPYYLDTAGSFGFLINSDFKLNEDQEYTREIQILNGSLDKSGRSNKNYYADRYQVLISWITKNKKLFESNEHVIMTNMMSMPSFQLDNKVYLFNNNKTNYSQFRGITTFGPYEGLTKDVKFVFIFENRFKNFANELYFSLIGRANPGTFQGMDAVFGIKLNTSNVSKITIENVSKAELTKAILATKKIAEDNNEKEIISIFIEDYHQDLEDISASEAYYFMKYHFIKNKLPLQVINYKKLKERNGLKWSTSNIGLGIFSKLGGKPWIVKPSMENSLILGLNAVSFRKNKDEAGRRFAYSVCLDSSGLYKSLEVLADENDGLEYIEKFKFALSAYLDSGILTNYSSCVLHLPFKIRREEIYAIEEVLRNKTSMKFVVMKVNTKNKFFGFSMHNTRVPFESCVIKLSDKQYLAWFEGMQYGKNLVDKRVSNPVHIEFLHINEDDKSNQRKYLQDVINLSGANWRGFNSKSVPISIYYAKLIAKYTTEFDNLDVEQLSDISNNKPWFL